MPPVRPIPDLCLIAIFQMMPPDDQLMASMMAPRCAFLVRAANRPVKTLIITDRDFTKNSDISKQIKSRINFYSLASKPSMQQLMDDGETFPGYLMPITHLSKWNCLHLDRYSKLDIASTEQIANSFSAITDLKFFNFYDDYSLIFENAASLLNHPTWKCQLTNLMVDKGRFSRHDEQDHRLIPAINGLTALQQLAIDWNHYNTDIRDLPILAQLKVVIFKSYYLAPFLRCLERHAADNAHLQVHLIFWVENDLFSLSEPLRNRIVRYERSPEPLDYTHYQVPLLCSHFRSLISLSIKNIKSTQVEPLFTALSQLQQLVHLSLKIIFGQDNEELAALQPLRPLAKLNSLQSLGLILAITSHSQIEWLNLSVTMPNLKTIYVAIFRCYSCKVGFSRNSDNLLSVSSTAFDCVRASLFHLHSKVPLTQFILQLDKERTSVEKLLLQSE